MSFSSLIGIELYCSFDNNVVLLKLYFRKSITKTIRVGVIDNNCYKKGIEIAFLYEIDLIVIYLNTVIN